MKAISAPRGQASLRDLLNRDHTLNGGILFGIDGYVIEVQARAMEVLRKPVAWGGAVSITGTLEALRQPIEAGVIHISRVRATLTYPCQFTLVAAMNPCPCGFFGTDDCRCSVKEVENYQKKLSGPILDRIDLQVELRRLSLDERFAAAEDEVSPKIRQMVQHARERQHERFQGTDIPFNAAIPGGHVRDFCNFAAVAFDHYKRVIEERSLSTRSMDRLAKVAQTLADLRGNDQIEVQNVDEAKGYVVGGILRDGN